MKFADPSSKMLLAASGGDTVKLFDVSMELADPCTFSFTPSHGCQVNSVKWNHTNMVVASAGEDKKISLWRKNGQNMGTIPVAGTDSGDNIEESILAISFSNKASRYICSGGSGQVVRIWDLQRKRCIKRLRGHTNTITGAMYNCRDEHLASISVSGDLILHNLASGARAAELKDPNQQVLRVLDYSRASRHLLVTAGDDGTVHMWETTGRSPKMSWLKQHSAPTTGISFSPSNDKIIASVGLDKKMYIYDMGSRRPSSIVTYESPFSSMAFKEDGFTLAAGTTNGRVVFYDVRGKPQPYTVLRAYSSSEAVTSLCWQRSKPVIVNESTCTPETALLGSAVEDSILMPDPEPSVTSSNPSQSTALSGSRNIARSVSVEASLTGITSGSISSTLHQSSAEETPHQSHIWPGKLTRLHAPRSSYNFKDDMEVFSPLVDVKPITPSLSKLWDERDGAKIDTVDKKTMSPLFPSSRRFPFAEDSAIDHPIFDWKSNSVNRQDDTRSSFAALGSTPPPSSKTEDNSITPPEAWGGERVSDKFTYLRQPSRFLSSTSGALTSRSSFSGLQDLSSSTSQTSTGSSSNSNPSHSNSLTKDVSSNQETPLGFPEHVPFSSLSLKGFPGQLNPESTGSLTMPRRFSTYAERISSTASFSDGTSHSVGSPKTKKTGAETREDLLGSLLSKPDAAAPRELGVLPAINGCGSQSQNPPQPDLQEGTSFTLQLFQRTLEETLDSFQKSIHEDVRNLHIEILRQFHMQEMEMSSVMNTVLENQAELMKEVKSLRKENEQLRRML